MAMNSIPNKINSTIAALLSARSFYEFHLDQASIPPEDIALIKYEVKLIDQVLDNEVEKEEAVGTLLELCESLKPQAPGAKDKLDASIKKVRVTLEHQPQLLVETSE